MYPKRKANFYKARAKQNRKIANNTSHRAHLYI